MTVYGIILTPLLEHLGTSYPERDPKMVAFANDLISTGRLSKLRSWWKDLLLQIFSKTKQDKINC